MNDTGPEIEKRFIQMIMERSGQERLEMGFSMFDMARQQVIASIIRNHPAADQKEVKKRLFLCFYGEEFSPEEQKKIITYLERYRSSGC